MAKLIHRKGPLPDNHPLKGARVIFGQKRPSSFAPRSPDGELALNPAAALSPAEMQEQYALQRQLERSLGLGSTPATASAPPSTDATTGAESEAPKPNESSPPRTRC